MLEKGVQETYKLEEVARSICSSRAEFEANHPAIMLAACHRVTLRGMTVFLDTPQSLRKV
jgi:hypothetical protein